MDFFFKCSLLGQSSSLGYVVGFELLRQQFNCFGLFLGTQEKGSVMFTVEYEFVARSKPIKEYVSKCKGNYAFIGGKAVRYSNLFGIAWTDFMADDNHYFINGILHLRAELTIKSMAEFITDRCKRWGAAAIINALIPSCLQQLTATGTHDITVTVGRRSPRPCRVYEGKQNGQEKQNNLLH
ncbi:unnamed protein product, partial [Vitis vinifera]